MDVLVQLPDEIVTEILLRLPVKSVVRFTKACKSWYSIIHNTYLAKSHFNLAPTDPDSNFFSPSYYGQSPSKPLLLYKQDADGTIHAEAFDVLPEYQFAVFRNSCHGLLCFFDRHHRQICVWNPCLPTQVKIVPSLPSFPDILNDQIALGYDPTTDDYKIVKIPYKWSSRNDKYVRVETFSFKSNSWKSERFSICTPVDYSLTQALVYANSRVHWFVYENYEDMTSHIMYFDVVQGGLKVMNVPPRDQLLCYTLMNYKDTIATLGDSIDDAIEYWVLEEYCGMKSSWKKMFSINYIEPPWKTWRSTGVTLNGESFVRIEFMTPKKEAWFWEIMLPISMIINSASFHFPLSKAYFHRRSCISYFHLQANN